MCFLLLKITNNSNLYTINLQSKILRRSFAPYNKFQSLIICGDLFYNSANMDKDKRKHFVQVLIHLKTYNLITPNGS